MKYLLDSNICIYFLNRRSEQLIQRFNTINPKTVCVCSIVKAELIYGALKSGNPEKNLMNLRDFFTRFQSFPFDDRAAECYGRIRTGVEKAGLPIGPNDLCIAAISIVNNLTLVTHNAREFRRISGLNFEDWA